jgi:flavin-dependent dehydrogenase
MLENSLKYGTDIVWNCKCESIEKLLSGYLVNGTYNCKNIILACGALGGQKLGGIISPHPLPVGISARIYGECDYRDDTFYYFYDEKIGDGYAWIFPVGKNLWNIGVWSSNRKNVKELFAEFEVKVFKTNKNRYDRIPKGALIGATNIDIGRESEIPCIGDCAFSSDYYTGEGISFAIENGMDYAKKLIEKDYANGR